MREICVEKGQSASLKRSLKLWQVIVLGLGYLTPLTVFDTYGIVTQETSGHVPSAYLLALAAMLFTASSYGKMVKVFPVAGSAYSYTRQTINPHLGFLVGWVSLLDYVFLPIVNVLLGKIYMSAAFPDVPDWMLGVVLAAVVTAVNLWKIDGTANFNTLLVAFQVFVVTFFTVLAISYITEGGGSGDVANIAPFYSANLTFPSLMAGAAILCFSFLGFDAVTTYTEETIDPMKNIPRGIFLVALIGGVIFIVASYFTQLAFPDITQFENPDSPSPEMSMALGGPLFHSLFVAGSITAAAASGIASHASVSRLLYAMGRENVLPKRLFGYLNPRSGIPVVNVVLVGILSLSALFLDLETALAFINFGALTAFTAVNVCVIFHYFIKEKMRAPKDVFRYLISPLVGAGFVAYLWWNLDSHSLTVGMIWSLLGIGYLLYTTKGFSKKPPEINFEDAI
ncbi:APC family permease [Brevibacillus marinus]|uniref:APC family permease n=1 Tax=Brevibacillus marinus TaxID=2496837 RepID=UPI000F83B84A|nr:APC family permease [Brevibacillus marinus]